MPSTSKPNGPASMSVFQLYTLPNFEVTLEVLLPTDSAGCVLCVQMNEVVALLAKFSTRLV